MSEKTYNGLLQSELEASFLDIKRIFEYGDNIIPISLKGEPFQRVGAHIVFVPEEVFKKSAQFGKNIQEIQHEYKKIISLQKYIRGEKYVTLIDNKTDQTREVIDYIVGLQEKIQVYVISPDNMFWFFHDLGHGYLSDICNNFYENVYGFPEMLVNIFACIKQKQYKLYSRKIIEIEIREKCIRYKQEDKDYFFQVLDSLSLENDL